MYNVSYLRITLWTQCKQGQNDTLLKDQDTCLNSPICHDMLVGRVKIRKVAQARYPLDL